MPEGSVLYEGGLPLGRRGAHDPDLAVDVTARDGVVHLTETAGCVSFAHVTGALSPAEAFELSYALREAGRKAYGVPTFEALVAEGAVGG